MAVRVLIKAVDNHQLERVGGVAQLKAGAQHAGHVRELWRTGDIVHILDNDDPVVQRTGFGTRVENADGTPNPAWGGLAVAPGWYVAIITDRTYAQALSLRGSSTQGWRADTQLELDPSNIPQQDTRAVLNELLTTRRVVTTYFHASRIFRAAT